MASRDGSFGGLDCEVGFSWASAPSWHAKQQMSSLWNASPKPLSRVYRGKGDGEDRTLSLAAFDVDYCSMGVTDRLYQRQADTDAARGP